jgi:PAS domain S-box-containing protein
MLVREDAPWVQEISRLRARVTELEARVSDDGRRDRRESEKMFRLMADAAPVMLWTSGPDTLRTFFNRRWLEFRGRRLEQELGNGWAQGVHPDDLRRSMELYLTNFRARREIQMEYRLLRADGEYWPIADTGVPVFEPGGAFAGYVGSAVENHARARPLPESVASAAHVPLTDREKQVAILIAEGRSTKQVATALGISYKTADSHRSKIMEKLKVHETASLVRWAVRHNLIKP